jgi:hypothetical protein
VTLAPGPLGEPSQVLTLPAADLQHGVGLADRRQVDNPFEDGGRGWGAEKSPAGCEDLRRIARLAGFSILGLQQVDVAAARDVEGMPSATHDTPLLAPKGQPTAVNRAEKRDHNASSLSTDWAVTLCLSRAPGVPPALSEHSDATTL